jgi:hypothetical protein
LKQLRDLTLGVLGIAIITACALPGGISAEPTALPTLDLTSASFPTATPGVVLSPTPIASPTVDTALTNLAPTALPPPTQIVPATSTPDPSTAGTQPPGAAPAGPGISINPAVGEPGDVILVNGSGFPAEIKVTLSWGPTSGPTGPKYVEVDTDASGAFTIGIIVLPAARWPGGAPKERDLLQLRATAREIDPFYYWANFTYIKRFVNPTPAPQQTVPATAKP